ncbi:MAG TPA: ExeM/NucH family extracellular endonuclease [Dokdonella sp.]|uniref:ExeM/NucH family extracellular endonuclease n=1 Tax=Dokdonella sp. TaxID=2291710 RepID=UPI002C898B9F|nr:ExeM/NucH family extracellular endonuclease [Dokdonella sp.]HUD43014.1 ExeM/NucH family extracellular endonuclease [Dokdonella sp.]
MAFALAALACATAPAAAQVALTALDQPYTQSFDTLPASGSAAWVNNSTVPGWFHARTGSGATIAADTGASNAGNLYSYGASGSSDRALGSIGSGNAAVGSLFWGLRLQNATGTTITALDVAYTGEQWRNGGATGSAATQTITFSYLIGAPAVTGSLAEFQQPGVAVPSLDFTGPVTTGSAAALNGNLAANRTDRSFTITGLSVPPGGELMLRWSDPDHTGADHGLAIDEVSVTARGEAAGPELSVGDVTLAEGDSGTTAFTFAIGLSEPAPAGGVHFDIATVDDTATAPSDYAALALTGVTIPPGSDGTTVTVLVNGDALPEDDEVFLLRVSNLVGATVANDTGIGLIVNDDAGVLLRVDDVGENEGDGGNRTFTFTVSLSEPAPSGGVTFDIATADGSAIAPSDYVARALSGQTIPAGSDQYAFAVTVNGDTAVEPDESFYVRVSNVTGAIAVVAEGVGTIRNDDAPPASHRIHQLQGSGASTPIGAGVTVSVEGVVTASHQGGTRLSGFFVQEEDADADSNPATSEGIFVYCGSCPVAVAEGQRVRISGTVSEYFGMTQLNATTAAAVVVASTGNHLDEITPAPIVLPVSGDVDAFHEAREGMLVTYVDPLIVSEYFQLHRFGQITLYPGERPRQFTEDNAPSAAGYAAYQAELARRRVILDDDNDTENVSLTMPDGQQFVFHPRANGGFGIGTQGMDFFRGGDQVQNLTGVLHWSYAGFTGTDAWRIRPTLARPATFTVANPRPATAPAVPGAIKAAGFNVLNYFSTIDTSSSSSSGSCGPSGTLDCRGADSAAELARQRERTALVVCGLDADVVGLVEIENHPSSAAVNDLLGAVNARCGGSHPYAFANTGGALGSDAIRVALIYRSGVLAPVGAAMADLNAIHNRPPTAQTFDVVDAANPAFGERFTVVANHFKSKGCSGASGADADSGDGQSCFASRRNQQASRLLSWINGTVIPAAGDPDVLLLGDFNSYARETPMTTLAGGGYVDLIADRLGPAAYSYLFDGQLGHLDYALANASLDDQVAGVAVWHINADEVPLFDYNDEIRDVGEPDYDEKPNGSALTPPRSLFEPASPYRVSDHDPVVVGLFAGTAEADLSIALQAAPDPVVAGTALSYAVTVENLGPAAAGTVSLALPLPAGTTFAALTAAAGWSCTSPAVGAAGSVSCQQDSFAPGTAAFTISAMVDADRPAGSSLAATATVSSASADPATGNNSASAGVTVAASADLAVAMSGSPDLVAAGDALTYTLTLSNLGPSAAATVVLSDTLPAALRFTSLSAPSGWSCTTPAVGQGGMVSCQRASMAVGTAEFTLVTAVAADASGSIANTATAAAATSDPVPGNQSATATTTVSAPQADLSVTLTDAPDPVEAGGMLTYTITVANAGPAAAATATLGDTLPAATRFVSLSAPSGWACTTPAIGQGGSVGCQAATFAVGTAVFTLVVEVASDAGGTTLSNTATVASATADPAGGNDSATTTTVVSVPAQADLSVTITDDRDFVQAGDTLDYRITVRNAGPAAATATVTDVLPAVLTDGVWICSASNGASCADGSGEVLSDVVTLPAGGEIHYVYSATVQAGGDDEPIVNGVGVAVSGGVTDPNLANDSASDSATLIVLFRDDFEQTEVIEAFAAPDASGYVGAAWRIDAGALARLGAQPVRIATAETAAGDALFALDLLRLDARMLLRVVVRDAQGRTSRGAWQVITDPSAAIVTGWQAATGIERGYVGVAPLEAAVVPVFHGRDEAPARLRIVDGGAPWLAPLAR